MSPVLFLVFVNDMRAVLESRLSLFADDSVLWSDLPTVAEQQEQLGRDLASVAEWGQEWGMELQPAKCRHMEVSRTRGGKTDRVLRLGDVAVPRAKDFKLLGVVVSDNLSWDRHDWRGASRSCDGSGASCDG